MSTQDEKYFKNGIEVEIPRKMNAEFGCAVLFYSAIFAQVIMAFAIFGSKNSEVSTLDSNGSFRCPSGYTEADQCGDRRVMEGWSLCVNPELCDELRRCVMGSRRLDGGSSDVMSLRHLDGTSSNATTATLASSELPPARVRLQRNLARRLLSDGAHVPESVWAFMEEHVYQPMVLFFCAAMLAVLWLFFLQKAALAAIWGTIAADVVMLLAVFLWYKIDFDVWNWPCIVAMAVIVLGVLACKKQISDTAVILTQSMLGLRANARIFAVSAGVQIVWVLYFAQWVAALVSMHFVLRATPDAEFHGLCGLTGHSVLGSDWTAVYFVLCYYWVTWFTRNVILMLVTANISGWYFQQPGSQSFWCKALPWSVGVQGGGNAMASAIMGLSEYLMNRIGSTWGLVFSLLTPWNWILILIALVLKTILQTYTKFGLIAMTFSGRTFCEASGKGFQLLSSKLGRAVLTDYLGNRIMAWASYMIALGTGFAAWAWADDVQGISSFGEMNRMFLTTVVIVFAYLLSYPFLTLVVVVLIEKHATWYVGDDPQERAMVNSLMTALFMASIAMFILTAISKLVVNAMDVIFFCFAVEADNKGRQERFAELYSSIKTSVVEGGIQGQNVVQGNAVGEPPQGPAPAPEPTVVVVGHPVNSSGSAAAASA